MAIIAFLVTSLIITRLVFRVRKQAEEALSSVSYRAIQAEEQERQRIAKDLHEDIGQRLTLLALEIEQIKPDSFNAVDMPGRINTLWKHSVEILSDVKTLAHELHSPRLEYLGMAAVMRSFCRDLSEQKRMEIDFKSDNLPSSVPREISLCLFRVLQEALHNAAKHSGVRQFDVQLKETANEIHLTVGDCGVGFDLEAARKAGGLGLNHMHERLKLVKGALSIDSQSNRGTTIHARVPLSLGSDSIRVVGSNWRNIAITFIDPVLLQNSGFDRNPSHDPGQGRFSVGIIACLRQQLGTARALPVYVLRLAKHCGTTAPYQCDGVTTLVRKSWFRLHRTQKTAFERGRTSASRWFLVGRTYTPTPIAEMWSRIEYEYSVLLNV